MGWPTDSACTMDIVPVPERPLAARTAMALGRRGYIRARGVWLGRDEGGYYFEEVEPEWFEQQERHGWPDQQRPFEERKKLVASTYLVNHLLWLSSIRSINEHNSDFYVHISPQVFNHRTFDKRTNFESIASRYRATLPTLVLPSDLEQLPFQAVLDLRMELSVARLNFRKEVETVINDYAKASDERSLDRLNGVLLEMARQRFEDTKKTITAARLKTTLKAIGLTLTPPAIISCISSMLDIGLFVPAALVAAVAFGAAEVLSLKDMAGVEERKSPWAYLTAIEAKTQRSRWQWFWRDSAVELFDDEAFVERMARPDPIYM
jgi:hypothetical protein